MADGTDRKQSLNGLDITIVVVYLLVVVATSFYAMCKSKRDTATGYFLGGRFFTYIPVGASIFSSNIGSEHFIGLTGSGAATGLAVSAYECLSVLGLIGLSWVFAPVYMAAGVTTLPEYMQKRFGGRRIQICLSGISLILYSVTKVSVTIFSAALFIKTALQWDFVPAVLLILGITALCTISGGLAAVIFTDTLQTVVMCIGSFILMSLAFVEVEGIQELFRRYMEAIPNDRPENSTCGVPGEDSLRMLRGPGDAVMPWPGFLFGALIGMGTWYWCGDQVIVQRALAAKNISHAQGGTILAGYLKQLPLFILVMPGMISRVLYTDDVACASPEVCKKVCGNEAGCSNIAYPLLVMNLLPNGIRGIMVAVMLAGMISSLTSFFNSASSLFTMDIYPLFRKEPSNREQMFVGRAFVALMTLVSTLWIPVVESSAQGQLFVYIVTVISYFAPPISMSFLLAILWPRSNEHGTFWGLMTGFITGGIRMVLEFSFGFPKCGEVDPRPNLIRNVHFMYFALILWIQTVIVIIVVSLLTEPTEPWRLIRTTYWSRMDTRVRRDETPKTDKLSAISSNLVVEEKFEEIDSEIETSCWQRFGVPTMLDAKSNQKGCGRLMVDWLKFGTSWFCGFSLEDPEVNSSINMNKRVACIQDTEPAEFISMIEERAQGNVNLMVKSIQQKPKIKMLLAVNMALVLNVMVIITVLFSIPVW